ncbi:MAG: hypothetical protein M3Q92_06670 [Actinomycetota bacterium]|nr:hypothetical protein [Actinomycetota bacterium]
MFNDINEAKDAIDGLADHLDQEAGAGRGDEAAATAPPEAEPPETFTLEA